MAPKKENAEYERRGREFFIYLPRPGCACFPVAPLHSSPHILCRPGGLCFSQAPVFSAIQPANPTCPGVAKGPCAAPSQAPSVAARRRRYNTLDLARQDRVPREALPPLDTPATKPRFHWMLPASGDLPLWIPYVRGTLFHSNPLATKLPGFIGFVPTGKKQNENRDAHSAFSLPKGTGPL